MAKKSSKVSTIEILVAIVAVIFVFSLIGVINLPSTAKTIATSSVEATGTVQEKQTVTATGNVGGITRNEQQEIVVSEGSTTDVGKANTASGTTLSPAWSNFEVMP